MDSQYIKPIFYEWYLSDNYLIIINNCEFFEVEPRSKRSSYSDDEEYEASSSTLTSGNDDGNSRGDDDDDDASESESEVDDSDENAGHSYQVVASGVVRGRVSSLSSLATLQ